MSTEVQQQSNSRSVFKMNTEFWQQARGPPLGPQQTPSNIMISTSPIDNQHQQQQCGSLSPSGHQQNNNGPVLSPQQMHQQQPGTSVLPLNSTDNMQLQIIHHQQQQQLNQSHQQQNHQQMNQPPQSSTPGGSSTPDTKLTTEKLVNEFQVSFLILLYFFIVFRFFII